MMADNVKKKAPQIPESVEVLSAFWDLSQGEHPYGASSQELFTPPLPEEGTLTEHMDEVVAPFAFCRDGHNTMADGGLPDYLGTDIKAPVSPCFARDIAGRVIYLGAGPERKTADDWSEPSRKTFPKGCRLVNARTQGAALIEEVFFTRFRSLEMSVNYDSEEEMSILRYKGANLHPYKLRPDTFYQDGWRLPQVDLLYARRVDEATAEAAVRDLFTLWEEVRAYTSADEFLENKELTQELFLNGCTLIPTTGAHNGYYRVAEDYTVQGRYDGRAVDGLHEVVGQKVSDLPAGTILETVDVGYVTPYTVVPAQVIVSDGVRYNAQQKLLQAPLYPDLSLPHQRTAASWGACWLPTAPHHFDAPSTWDWCVDTGRFLQVSGPLWDPLHYYYESSDLIIQAFKAPLAGKKHLARVPKEMKQRFYPVAAIYGFDVVSGAAKAWRADNNILPASAVSRVRDDVVSSTVGYHPMPPVFEYELFPEWFPEFMPHTRMADNPRPTHLEVAPVIKSHVSPQDYLANVQDLREQERLLAHKLLATATGNPMADFHYLKRYTTHTYDEEVLSDTVPILTVPRPQRLPDAPFTWTLESYREATGNPFYQAMIAFKEASYETLCKRSAVYHDTREEYYRRFWLCEWK